MEQPGTKQSRGGLDRVRKPLGGGLAWWEFSPIHTVSASSLRHQAHSLVNKLMVTLPEGWKSISSSSRTLSWLSQRESVRNKDARIGAQVRGFGGGSKKIGLL